MSQRTRRPKLESERLHRFEEHVAGYRSVFPRADQAQHFRDYVLGLLDAVDRKNVEAIAAAAGRARETESDLAQALQHFVSQSPWESGRLFSVVRKQSATLRRDPESVWVVHDAVFPKKGQHSVGVHRQFARALGKKLNCQIGVLVAQVGPAGYFPLAARLYLPANWLKENGELAAKSVPAEFRLPASKAEIAVELLAELIEDGEAVRPVTAESGYLGADEFAEGLARHQLTLQNLKDDRTREALRQLEWLKAELGLDHFEGRTWHGWHHHISLVFAAYAILAEELRLSHL